MRMSPMARIYNTPGAMLKSLQDIVTGLSSSPPPGLTQLAAGGKVSTIQEIVAEFKGYLGVYAAADSATKERDKALLSRNEIAPTATTRVEALHASLKSALG